MSEKNIKPIILLSGPVGAGKTTVAQEMVKLATEPTVWIEGDKFWFFIAKGFNAIGRSKNFRIIMTSMIAASLPYAINGYGVILDFSIPPWFLDTARKIAGAREVPLDYVVLRPDENICAERAANRTEGIIKDYSAYHNLYVSFDEAGQNIIYDNFSEAAAIANTVMKGLMEELFRIS
ncbi:MAG TPA: AAA family ATPase [Chitinophagaceae bacterium]